ncbi:hypothetical protein [Anabaena azotica]|uniref:Uncharacterized protein n=1 Tax=Anabaena azotica FACHB-119 TaxID=947527 RepID=A0ABR8D9W3_9NOST|nr:hypothetical protein [Anabaena azotica]MBD2503419.1 hypothetical protein [Anabaena azotica FACHB-119]
MSIVLYSCGVLPLAGLEFGKSLMSFTGWVGVTGDVLGCGCGATRGAGATRGYGV